MEFLQAATAPLVDRRMPVPPRQHARRAALSALCTLACVLVVPAARAQAVTQTFSYTGGEQTFTVPAGVFSLEVRAVGGRGGNSDKPGGAAAQVTGDFKRDSR